MPRGGNRQGAGAPRGNINAFKTGSYSRQLLALIYVLIASPFTHRLLIRLTQADHKTIKPVLKAAIQKRAKIDKNLKQSKEDGYGHHISRGIKAF